MTKKTTSGGGRALEREEEIRRGQRGATRAATTTAPIEAFKAGHRRSIPSCPGPYRNLGLAYRALNRCADALPSYEKYLELKPESRFTERVRREIDLCRAKLGRRRLPTRPDARAAAPAITRPRRSRTCTSPPT